MKISDILSLKKPSLSFEVFPPKRDKPLEGTKEIVSEIALTHPSFMSVTYGAAGGNTSANTLAIAEHLMHKCSVNVLAHLTCVGSTHQSISSEIAKFKNAGIENILCLRGDMPGGDSITGKSDFVHAVDLVKKLSSEGFCLGGACYPEGHIESANMDADLDNVKKKVEAGCDFLTTQMFFDNSAFYSFLHGLSARGVAIPVIAGIMPITSGKQIKKSCELSGATLPIRFKRIVDKYGDNPESMKQAGIVYACEQIVDLLANGVAGVHVYTMNKPEVASAIYNNVKSLIGK
jgi:methylenetetrahydrofolate reductase (NADPH)